MDAIDVISILFPTVSPEMCGKCLGAIFNSNYTDFEVIVDNVAGDSEVRRKIEEFGVREINGTLSRLRSRLSLINEARGEKILLLDDTRVISKQLLGLLSNSNAPMVAIAEKEMGNGLISLVYNLEKKGLQRLDPIRMDPIALKSVIPRAYDSGLLKKASQKIQSNIGSNITDQLNTLDLELLYFQAFQESRKVDYFPTPEIFHFAEGSFAELWGKYFKYGMGQRLLEHTCYNLVSSMYGRTRKGLPISSRLLSLPALLLRSVPYILGYAHGS